MKKYLFLMLAIIGMAVSLTACSSDDDDSVNAKDVRLVGTWHHKGVGDELTFDKNGSVEGMIVTSKHLVTVYKHEGAWYTTNNSTLHIDWKKAYSTSLGQSDWKEIKDVPDDATVDYFISDDGKTLTITLDDSNEFYTKIEKK